MIPSDDLAHLVAHRGFHSPLDRSDRRPLENSLAAYEAAWANGISLCECDVMLTRDGFLVLVIPRGAYLMPARAALPDAAGEIEARCELRMARRRTYTLHGVRHMYGFAAG